jgi:hypothetical protein
MQPMPATKNCCLLDIDAVKADSLRQEERDAL